MSAPRKEERVRVEEGLVDSHGHGAGATRGGIEVWWWGFRWPDLLGERQMRDISRSIEYSPMRTEDLY